jgi:hypothetical protein
MNKLFAAMMTLIILGTVVVVFGLGALSIMGGPQADAPSTTGDREQMLLYGTDFDDWAYLSATSDLQWRWDTADDGQSYLRLRRVISPTLLVYALLWQDQIVARAYGRAICEQGSSLPSTSLDSDGNAKVLVCVADRDGTTWLKGETLLPSPALWQEDFGPYSVREDLSSWDWALVAQRLGET